MYSRAATTRVMVVAAAPLPTTLGVLTLGDLEELETEVPPDSGNGSCESQVRAALRSATLTWADGALAWKPSMAVQRRWSWRARCSRSPSAVADRGAEGDDAATVGGGVIGYGRSGAVCRVGTRSVPVGPGGRPCWVPAALEFLLAFPMAPARLATSAPTSRSIRRWAA